MDSFGTEPAFNLGSYARSHGYKTLWGSWGLQPLQYMTMFRKCFDLSAYLSFFFQVADILKFFSMLAVHHLLRLSTHNGLQERVNIVRCAVFWLIPMQNHTNVQMGSRV